MRPDWDLQFKESSWERNLRLKIKRLEKEKKNGN